MGSLPTRLVILTTQDDNASVMFCTDSLNFLTAARRVLELANCHGFFWAGAIPTAMDGLGSSRWLGVHSALPHRSLYAAKNHTGDGETAAADARRSPSQPAFSAGGR